MGGGGGEAGGRGAWGREGTANPAICREPVCFVSGRSKRRFGLFFSGFFWSCWPRGASRTGRNAGCTAWRWRPSGAPTTSWPRRCTGRWSSGACSRRQGCHPAAPPLPSAGVSREMERGCQQIIDSLADGAGACPGCGSAGRTSWCSAPGWASPTCWTNSDRRWRLRRRRDSVILMTPPFNPD